MHSFDHQAFTAGDSLVGVHEPLHREAESSCLNAGPLTNQLQQLCEDPCDGSRLLERSHCPDEMITKAQV